MAALSGNRQPEHPSLLDYEWVASDSIGHVALFTTGGPGPIPTWILENRAYAERVVDLVHALRASGGHILFVRVPRPDDFVRFARQGLYSYDWRDVARTHGKTAKYEICARPTSPVTVDGLPEECRALLRQVSFRDVRFDATDAIEVRAYFRCQP
jgi:hypothetical protein